MGRHRLILGPLISEHRDEVPAGARGWTEGNDTILSEWAITIPAER